MGWGEGVASGREPVRHGHLTEVSHMQTIQEEEGHAKCLWAPPFPSCDSDNDQCLLREAALAPCPALGTDTLGSSLYGTPES